MDGAPKPVRHLVLDAAPISGIDASAVGAIREVHAGLRSRNITFEMARATDELREQFDDDRPDRADRRRALPRHSHGRGGSLRPASTADGGAANGVGPGRTQVR